MFKMFALLFSSTSLGLFVLSIVSTYFYVKYLYSYWRRRGVPYLKPSFPFGNFGQNFLQKLSIAEQLDEFYCSTSEPLIGVYGLFRPTLIACDPDLIRNILIKDFQHFSDRGVYVDQKNDPLSAHLFSLEGDKWKNLRMKLTPTFTSGKMKAIFSTLLDCRNPLLKYMENVAAFNETVEVRELTACYTTNVIASVAFGIDIDCHANPNTPFRKYGRQVLDLNFKNAFRFICWAVSPTLLKWSGLHIMDREVEQFFFDMVKQTLEMREKNNIVRKDFFQLLVQLRNTGSIQLDDEWQTVITNNNTQSLTLEQLTAQSFVFFMAGFGTSSSTTSYCLYEMSKNLDIQQKAQEEIDRVFKQYGGKFTYESINELKYLNCCIEETLRKYPVFPLLSRLCVKDYTIPGTDLVVEKGTSVIIPVFSLHRDEKYYPDPEKFDPSRFFSENRNGKTIVEMPYLPFGDGPRNCIGMRMGKMSTKVGIASILQNYNVEVGKQHIDKDLQFSSASLALIPATGIHLKFTPRNCNA